MFFKEYYHWIFEITIKKIIYLKPLAIITDLGNLIEIAQLQ